MIINSITLKNFRSYENETTFSFTPKADKNIVLIGGENGSGKSTLFEAIKLCIYGHIAYGYLGENYNYLTKIKNNINNNAFKNETVNSFISLSLSIKEGTELKKYILKRSWKYTNQKLIEDFKVYLYGNELNNEDKLFFDKYLKSILPPSLFDFFFFDGEELSEFFTGKNSSTNLKESVLELFNYDTFDILKKQLITYQRSNSKSNDRLKELQDNHDKISSSILELENKINSLEDNIEFSKNYLHDLNVKKDNVESSFRNSGGMLKEERQSTISEINALENERANIYQIIKDFCNDTLPFLLVTDLLEETKIQITKEDDLNSYHSVKNKLSGEVLKESLSAHNIKPADSNKIYDELAYTLLSNMFDKKIIENIDPILELSNEDKNLINFTIDNILSNKKSTESKILDSFERNKSIGLEIKQLKEKLNSTVSDEVLANYLENINRINQEVIENTNNLTLSEKALEQAHEDLVHSNHVFTRVKNELSALLQSNNTLNISNNLIQYLEELLKNLTKDKLLLIENEFMNIFSSIIRKNDYISSIHIDDNFDCTLYINKEYTSTNILNIINNIGFDGISKKYGSKFIDDLFKYYEETPNSNEELKLKIERDNPLQYFSLSTKVNINDFSNGEKQVYILCLIWAIIKSSGVEIPFIIDTPYARIDDSHRTSLSTTYLPNISNQVIILSTNKEIDSDLYKIIKPYLCNEYLLIYNTNERKTEVKNGYFEV